MPSRAQFRSRNYAIGRKGAYETDFLFSEDENIVVKPQLLETEAVKNVTSQPSSPTSVASALIPSEIKPFTLPGSWVVVGKGGRPLRNEKMYDEPVPAASAKKKKTRRSRSRKATEFIETEPFIATFFEGSSSKCLRELHHSATRHEKQVARSKDAKRWARYQVAKQLKRSALDELAAPELADTASCQAFWPLPMARTLPTKDNKANGNKDKARRRARCAAIAARCAFWDDDDELAPTLVELESTSKEARPPLPRIARPSGELQLCFGPLATSEEASTRVQLPGAWTAVGKRGKKVNDFPPLVSAEKAAGKTIKLSAEPTLGSKRRQSSEHGSPKQLNKREKSTATSIKCTVM